MLNGFLPVDPCGWSQLVEEPRHVGGKGHQGSRHDVGGSFSCYSPDFRTSQIQQLLQ